MLSMSPLLSTFVGALWLRRSEAFGIWWHQSFETDLKPGRALGPARLFAPAEDAETPQVLPVEPRPQAPRMEGLEGPHRRVVDFNTFARCLGCGPQTGKVEPQDLHPEAEPQCMHTP
eukprot:6489230-Amphidinium_carterae.1